MIVAATLKMKEANNTESYQVPEDPEKVEEQTVDLQAEIDGVQSASISKTSESCAGVAAYVRDAEMEDMLIVGESENRWKELIVKEEEGIEIPAKKGCCSVQ